jgi:hypothetical protein
MAQQFPTISLIVDLPVESNFAGFVIYDCHQHAFDLATGAGESIKGGRIAVAGFVNAGAQVGKRRNQLCVIELRSEQLGVANDFYSGFAYRVIGNVYPVLVPMRFVLAAHAAAP